MSLHADTPYSELLNDPRKYFERPEVLLKAENLSDAQRLELLERWELDERALLRAGTESPMTGGEQEMLAEVEAAIEKLKGTRDTATETRADTL